MHDEWRIRLRACVWAKVVHFVQKLLHCQQFVHVTPTTFPILEYDKSFIVFTVNFVSIFEEMFSQDTTATYFNME